jgi:hypothetical protein
MSAEELAERLAAIAEELGDLALDALRHASASAGTEGAPDPEYLAQERRLTRARRAVDKAAQLLGGASDDDAESP